MDSKAQIISDSGNAANSTSLNPFTTALFVLFAFGAILYGWGSNTSGHCEVIV